MADPLRDRIAAFLRVNPYIPNAHEHTAEALADIVRSFATSDAAVEAAARAICARLMIPPDLVTMGSFSIGQNSTSASTIYRRAWQDQTGVARAAITAALGGGDG